MRKGGLGKGLDALIPAGEETKINGGSLFIPVSQIQPNPRQPRHEIRPQDLVELAQSIKDHGVLQPIIVTQDPQTNLYTLIAGERRWRAAQQAGLTMVPVLVRQVTSEQQLELALIENVQREDLSPLETANAFQQLSDEFHLSHEEIAARVGKSRAAVTNTIRLLKLPESVLQALEANQISEGHARALLGLETTQGRLAALNAILDRDLTVRQTEELVRRMNGARPITPTPRPTPPEISALEEKLRSGLGTRVTLRHGTKGGTILIHYYSNEELDSLVSQILKE